MNWNEWSWVFETDPPEDERSIGDEDHEEETIDSDDDWESEEDHDESDIEDGQL
jgi:hypothetical protein